MSESTQVSVVRDQMLFSSAATDLVCTALAIAQGKFENPKRSKTATVRPRDGGHGYSWNYAPLEDIIDAVKGGLAEAGLSRHQFLDPDSRVLWTCIRHTSGQWLGTPYPVFHSKNDAQSFAGGVTYARRKGLCLLLGIAEEDDDDANVADGNIIQEIKPTQQAARKPREPAPNVMVNPRTGEAFERTVVEEHDKRLRTAAGTRPKNGTAMKMLEQQWLITPNEIRQLLESYLPIYKQIANDIDMAHSMAGEPTRA